MSDIDTYRQKMSVFNPLMEPVVLTAIKSLQLPAGSHGLDAGCGIGLQARRFAEAVGLTGHITGIDISPEFVTLARSMAESCGYSERLSFQEGDVSNLQFENETFDWAWSSCCVGYSAAIPAQSAIRELVRVVKPGGIVAIFIWSSERLLPGYPVLEAHLNATTSGIAPFIQGRQPEEHYLRALMLLRDAGLVGVVARTFAGDACAPLPDDIRQALLSLFEMRWPDAEAELPREDQSEFRRLCFPESPDFIVNQPDYYAFFTCSLFSGKVPTSS